MTCGFGCGSCVFSRPRPAGDEWDLWSLPLDLSLLSYEILPAAFTISFRSLPLPSCCWIGVPEVLPFSLPDFGQLAENLLQDVDLFTMGLCWRAFWKVASLSLEISYDISPWKISFSWSCLLLISGCFLSVTILYHSPKVSSIRRPHNVYMQYLCIIRIE